MLTIEMNIVMFEKYPKKRTELPEAYRSIYVDQYKKNREGDTTASGLAQKMEAWLHKKIAFDVKEDYSKRTLEIGAGTLNQLVYEKTKYYDVVEPFRELFSDSPLLNRINNVFADIDDIELKQQYDRITSVATFEHITDLPKVVAKTCIMLNPKGTLRTSIPNEGNFLWKLGWKMTTGLEYKLKHGLDYGILMQHEHVNTADEIEQVLNYFYGKNKCSCFGIGRNFALYRFYESSDPKIDLAKEYLKSIETIKPE
ncbi:MAG: methyltransferase domain-containing protein [Bacteroidales bacterium]